MNKIVGLRFIALLVASFVLIGILGSPADASKKRRHNPEAGKAKAAKRIGVGAAIGAGAGGLIGGRKGALIGAGAGAGAGTAYHVHKKRSWEKHHPNR
ncbi:MAG TPA: hypothetical protein VKN18_10535 [Blastocatellia bacterium]|nr:hypothetical protein [Blastocatellia bacterium]